MAEGRVYALRYLRLLLPGEFEMSSRCSKIGLASAAGTTLISFLAKGFSSFSQRLFA